MIYILITICTWTALILGYLAVRYLDNDYQAQRQLDKYLNGSLSPLEIGTFYERYIGHLYEIEGCYVEYHGALNGFSDLGRDLIVKDGREIYIIQTKCWANYKTINENHIFQLYGSMEHYKRTTNLNGRNVTAIFYTTAKYSNTAKEVAETLGVELEIIELDRSYPLIKCNVSTNGEKIYHLPFDPYYDKVKIKSDNGEFFVHTVKEAVDKGFRRAKIPKKVA